MSKAMIKATYPLIDTKDFVIQNHHMKIAGVHAKFLVLPMKKFSMLMVSMKYNVFGLDYDKSE